MIDTSKTYRIKPGTGGFLKIKESEPRAGYVYAVDGSKYDGSDRFRFSFEIFSTSGGVTRYKIIPGTGGVLDVRLAGTDWGYVFAVPTFHAGDNQIFHVYEDTLSGAHIISPGTGGVLDVRLADPKGYLHATGEFNSTDNQLFYLEALLW